MIGAIIAVILAMFLVIFLPLVFTNQLCTAKIGLCYKKSDDPFCAACPTPTPAPVPTPSTTSTYMTWPM